MSGSFVQKSISYFLKKQKSIDKFSAEYHGFDPNFSYFLFQASFGDKWMILSFIPELLNLQKNVRILASIHDQEIIRIFIGDSEIQRAIIFITEEKIIEISSLISINTEFSSQIIVDPHQLVQTQKIITEGLPKNIIRHLHIVKYPYFSDLHIVHGVPYADLLKMIMYIPANSPGKLPSYYTDQDRSEAISIIKSNFQDNHERIMLFNIVNISHKPLSNHQIISVVKNFSDFGFGILVNATGYNDTDNLKKILENKYPARCVKIPGHLLALVSDEVKAVFGVIGGAMCVATYFSKSHAMSIFAKAVGYSYGLDSVHAGRVSDNIWKIDGGAWPFMLPGRVAEHIDGGDLTTLDDKRIREIVSSFVNRI